jgi:hypothetical protein
MFQTRSLTTGFLVASLGIAAGLAVFTSNDVSAAGTPCSADSAKVPAVDAACKKGGKEEAKKAMKALTDKAVAAGDKVKCADCHSDAGPAYKTKADAKDQFDAKLLKYVGK